MGIPIFGTGGWKPNPRVIVVVVAAIYDRGAGEVCLDGNPSVNGSEPNPPIANMLDQTKLRTRMQTFFHVNNSVVQHKHNEPPI